MENRKRNVHLDVYKRQIVSRTAQISNRNTSRAARRDNARAKGATNIFSSIFIFKTSLDVYKRQSRRPLSMSYSPFRTSTEYIIVLYLEQYKLEAAY